jgi:hypothetical protein
MRSLLVPSTTCLVVGCLSCFPFVLSGCADSATAEVQELRQRWLVATPPPGEVAISAVRAKLKSGELAANGEVVVRARINAGDMPPWAEGRAEFIITDATGHDGDEDHDPHECPFCKRDIMDSMAQVRLAGKDGKTIPIDTRTLLGVQERSLLVIRATAMPGDSEMLILNANQIHIVPAK